MAIERFSCALSFKKNLGKSKKVYDPKAYSKTATSARKIYFVFEVKIKKKGSIKNYFDKIFGFSTFQSAWKKKLAKKLRRNGNYSHFNIEWR